MITLDRIAKTIGELAPLPQTATRLAQLLASPLYSIDECVAIIRFDQALTLDLLKYANSAFAGASRSVTNIKDAVTVANLVARSIGEGLGHEGMNIRIDENVAKRMKLSKEIFERICVRTLSRMRSVTAFFGTE